jgi:hypothetical protein
MMKTNAAVTRTVTRRLATSAVLLALWTSMSSAQSGVFRSARTFSFGGSSDNAAPFLVSADVGSPSTSPAAGAPDGIPDLITANLDQKALVLLGDGHGGFTTRGILATALSTVPSALAVGKFDDDSLTDLLVADGSSDRLLFFRGRSTGPPFETPGVATTAAHGAVAIGVGKVDGDTRLDAVVVGNGGQQTGPGTIMVLHGNGDGTFTPDAPISTGVGSMAIALWDANKDGVIDYAAVANPGGNNVSVLHNDGTGGFTLMKTYDVGEQPVAIAAEDLNGDGQRDLIIVDRTSDDIAILDGKAGGAFEAARFLPSGSMMSAPNSLVVTEVNDDKKLDIVVANNFSFDVSVLLGDGKGSFAAPRAFIADQEPLAIVADDFNHDQMSDIATVNHDDVFSTAAVLLNRGGGTFQAVENVITPQYPTTVTVGDVDNDGLPDLIAGDTNKELLVYRADPRGGFAPPVTLASNGDVVAVGSGDFNADGHLDLVAANRATNDLSVFLAQIGGGFATVANDPLGAAPSAVVVGDWNADGRSDLAVTFPVRQCSVTTTAACSSAAGCPAGHCSVTATRTCHINSECPSRETCQGAESCVGAVGILLAEVDGSFGPLTTLAVGAAPVAVDFGDFNKDGKLDLVVANMASNDLSILTGRGDGTFGAATSVPSSDAPQAVAVADFDRDGFDDIAVAQSGSVAVLYGNGQGAFGAGLPQGVGHPSGITARDVTGDSIPDLLVTDDVANTLVVLVGGGADRQFSSQDPVGLSRYPFSVVAADFDGDGRYDAAASYNNLSVSSLPVLTNSFAPAVQRGDGNGDSIVSAADAVAVMRKLAEHGVARVEDVRASGYAAAPGVDANGDGSVTLQDALAVAHRVFASL